MIVSVGGERRPHRVPRYVNHIHMRGIAVGDETGDGEKILAVGLHGVRGRFAGRPVVQKGDKPVRKRIGLGRIGSRSDGRCLVSVIMVIRHVFTLALKDG